jgi:transposase
MTTKATTRRSFTDEFKREAVSLLASSGRPLIQIATEQGIQPSMLRSWRGAVSGQKVAGAAGSGVAAAPSAEQAEIRRLRRELERAQTERDILEKAVGIFSGPPRLGSASSRITVRSFGAGDVRCAGGQCLRLLCVA